MKLAAALGVVFALLAAGPPAGSAKERSPAPEDGYDLWLRYRPVTDAHSGRVSGGGVEIVVAGTSPTSRAARDEL
jgi:alpha-glucuronidase